MEEDNNEAKSGLSKAQSDHIRGLLRKNEAEILEYFRLYMADAWCRGVDDALEGVPGGDEYASAIAAHAGSLENPFLKIRNMGEQKVYTDSDGSVWIEDPEGTHGWASTEAGGSDVAAHPFRPWPRIGGEYRHGAVLPGGTEVVRYYSTAGDPSHAAYRQGWADAMAHAAVVLPTHYRTPPKRR